MQSKPDQAQIIPALKVLGEPSRLRILHDLTRWLDAHPATIASEANPRSQPTKRKLVAAAIREVT